MYATTYFDKENSMEASSNMPLLTIWNPLFSKNFHPQDKKLK